jgi:hypothetical protein
VVEVVSEHLESCSTQHGYDECDCPARHGEYSLECSHCGGPAITSPSGLFGDGDGTECESCGFPGSVSVGDAYSEDPLARWNESNDDGATCNRADCEECAEWRAQLAAKAGAEEASKS